MNFSEKLYELRKKEGFSQEELAEKVNVSRQTVSKWEMGQSTPEMEKLIILSDIFNISIDELVGKEINNDIENKNDINIKPKKNHTFIKVLIGILCIYLITVVIKFIFYTRQQLIVDSFSENNYNIMISIKNSDERLTDICWIITKIGNKYLETQYNPLDDSSNPVAITYIELDKKKAYVMNYDEESKKYILEDEESVFMAEEKDEYFKKYENSEPIKHISSINKGIQNRILNSIDPLTFVNPFKNSIVKIAPFEGTVKYDYNKDCLLVRTQIKAWAMNNSYEWNYSYDYVPSHFENQEIINPIESGEYKIVKSK